VGCLFLWKLLSPVLRIELRTFFTFPPPTDPIRVLYDLSSFEVLRVLSKQLLGQVGAFSR